jgi:hypothetical protein
MKCFYYLSPTLADTRNISDDLHRSGVGDWFIHIVSKNEAGLHHQSLRSSNYLETLDLVRDGLIGAVVGLVAGAAFCALLASLQPAGTVIPWIAYAAALVVPTGFGAWVGGLVGISNENRKLRPFHDEIAAGKYLILVYANRQEESKVHSMMDRLHPEAMLVGLDPHFYNPFTEPHLVRTKAHPAI